jgi:hypothetical protein
MKSASWGLHCRVLSCPAVEIGTPVTLQSVCRRAALRAQPASCLLPGGGCVDSCSTQRSNAHRLREYTRLHNCLRSVPPGLTTPEVVSTSNSEKSAKSTCNPNFKSRTSQNPNKQRRASMPASLQCIAPSNRASLSSCVPRAHAVRASALSSSNLRTSSRMQIRGSREDSAR